MYNNGFNINNLLGVLRLQNPALNNLLNDKKFMEVLQKFTEYIDYYTGNSNALVSGNLDIVNNAINSTINRYEEDYKKVCGNNFASNIGVTFYDRRNFLNKLNDKLWDCVLLEYVDDAGKDKVIEILTGVVNNGNR